jgi:outer membrane lipoprotein-sorting protein
MRKLIYIAFALVLVLPAAAQYPGYTAVTDMGKFKEQFAAATQKTSSIKSNFVQEKNLAMLSEKITSKGKFWFRKESQVRMEYTQPYQYLMIINKDKVYVKDGQKENKVSTKSNKLFQQINRIMIDCMQGTALNNPDFKTRIFESKAAYMVELTPIGKNMKELFKTVNLVVDKKDYGVGSIEMHEPSGDETVIRFVNKELNTTLPDALFDIR